MDKILRKSLLEFLDDLTDIQKVVLIYLCLECPITEIAEKRGISKQAVFLTTEKINEKRQHQEIISALQEVLIRGGFNL